MTATLRLGSRRSPMAVAQSRQVAGMITERTGRQVEIVRVTTLGDVSRAELTQIGGTGTSGCAARTLSLTPRAASPMISIQ
jgi:hydroxymethylbilane synthase